MVQNPQFLINIRKNINTNNPGYGKYYPKAVEKETITLRGLAKHMSEHQCVYSRDIIEGVLMKMASCMIELIAQGNPIKIDGLGIFWPTVESTKEGITKEAILEGKWNANTYVKGVHIRFRPEGVNDDNITSRAFKDQCSLATYGVEEKIDITPEEQDPTKKEYIKKVTPLDDWIREQLAAANGGTSGGSGSGNGGGSGSQGGNQNQSTNYALTISTSGSGSANVTHNGNAVTSGSNLSENDEVEISITPAEGQTPTATLNGSSIALTEDNGVYTGSFTMPGQASTLVINTGSTGGGNGSDGLDQD